MYVQFTRVRLEERKRLYVVTHVHFDSLLFINLFEFNLQTTFYLYLFCFIIAGKPNFKIVVLNVMQREKYRSIFNLGKNLISY